MQSTTPAAPMSSTKSSLPSPPCQHHSIYNPSSQPRLPDSHELNSNRTQGSQLVVGHCTEAGQCGQESQQEQQEQQLLASGSKVHSDRSCHHDYTPHEAEGENRTRPTLDRSLPDAGHVRKHPAIGDQGRYANDGTFQGHGVQRGTSQQQRGQHVSASRSIPIPPDTGSSAMSASGGAGHHIADHRFLATHAQASSSSRSIPVQPNNESDERTGPMGDADPHSESPSLRSRPPTPPPAGSLAPPSGWHRSSRHIVPASSPQPAPLPAANVLGRHSNAYPPSSAVSVPPISASPSSPTLAPTRTPTSTHITTTPIPSHFHSQLMASEHMPPSRKDHYPSERGSGDSIRGAISSASSYDQGRRPTDTRSTYTSDTGQRHGHGLNRPVVKSEEDQEAPEGAAATEGALTGQRALLLGAGACYTSNTAATAAGTAAAGGEGEGRRGAGERGTAELTSRHPFATSDNLANSHYDNNNNNNISITGSSNSSSRSTNSSSGNRHYESHWYSPPPPASPSSSSIQEYPLQKQHPLQMQHEQLVHRDQMSESHYHKTLEGGSASSLSSSTTTTTTTTTTPSPFPPFTAGTSDPTASSASASAPASASASALPFPSPSMNHHLLPFDQTGQSPQFNHSFHPHADSPALGHKRRSIVDLHFGPAKNIKIKEKRNSSGASSVSSADDMNMDPHTGWTGHIKTASGTSTSSNTTTSSSARGVPVEPQQTLAQARKPSAAKGASRGQGGSTSSPKTFQCTGYPGCNMVFTRSEHLARHERKHTGEKPYKCIVPNCPRTFSRYDNMIQHTQTHGDRNKRDPLTAAGTGGGSRSRSSSVHSAPLLTGRPRTGSSPIVFAGYDDPRSMQNSPATSYMTNSGYPQQHRHSYSTHHSQTHHPQYSFPPGVSPVSSSSTSTHMSSRNSGGVGSHVHSGDNHPYSQGSGGPGPSMPVVRTLKANSRSLPHLQPRSGPRGSAESPSIDMQQSMSGMEMEELKRRKSEVLLPSSSYSGARAAAASGYGHNQGQAIGLGMSSFSPSTSHSQPLPHVEKLTPQEQERLNEHRRSAQAMLFHNESVDPRGVEYPEQGPIHSGRATAGYHEGSNSRPGNMNTPPHLHQLSAMEKDRLLEHRKSTPDLMYDAIKSKRSSNDPTDMMVQPLPSRDSRSGVQWYSQAGTPPMSSLSAGLTMTPRDSHGHPHYVGGGDSPSVLPPLMRDHATQEDRPTRPRALSSHIHPLSRPPPNEPSGPTPWSSNEDYKDRAQFDLSLSPRLERYLEERYYPIQKKDVVDVIVRMGPRDFQGLKAQVTETYANDQFRNPEFLGNMMAILCVIRSSHLSRRSVDGKHNSQVSIQMMNTEDDASMSRSLPKDMDIDHHKSVGGGNSMDVDQRMVDSDESDMAINNGRTVTPCRYALDIDVESFGRDPEPDLRSIEGLTITSLFPTRSFVAGFEPVMPNADGNPDEEPPRSARGYPSNARIGRFYLPEKAFRTPESLQMQPDPNGAWVCCRFEEFQGVSIWVLENVLQKYHEIAQRHKMALTLAGTGPVHYHRMTEHDKDAWDIRAGEQYDVKVKDTALYPEMIRQVWKDMHHEYYRHQFQQQHHHHHRHPEQHSQHPSNRSMGHSSSSSQMGQNNAAAYEEHQRNQWHREGHNANNVPGPGYSDFQQQQHAQSYLNHREDVSSVPSSPNSPRQEDYYQEDGQPNEPGSSTGGGDLGPGSAMNMHRRISVAELCNPMQSLATERDRDRDRYYREDGSTAAQAQASTSM